MITLDLEYILCNVLPIIIIIVIVILGYISYFNSITKFWKQNGVKGPSPIPIFGNFYHVTMKKTSMEEHLKKVYDDFYNEPMVGLYSMHRPRLLLRDLDLINNVLITDFSYFNSRNRRVHENVEPLSQNLMNFEYARWRALRTKLSPAFTEMRIKNMFNIITDCAENLLHFIDKIWVPNEPLEITDIAARYTIDVIGSCAFGQQMHAISDEFNEFRVMGKKVFASDWKKHIKLKIREHLPKVYDYLGCIFYDKQTTEFFINLIKQTIQYREKNNINRHDFVDHLRDVRNNENGIEMTDDLMAAQMFVFFTAGFETSAITISNALYELAQHQDVQKKLRKEIEQKLAKTEGLTYDKIKEIDYLHQIVQETLRKHPPAPHISRKSSKDYLFSGKNVIIPKDTVILISTLGIHRDPSIYPDPEIFNPDRFSKENIERRHRMAFLPFGNGPRNCIGERFAYYQIKVGLIKILKHYEVNVCSKTEIPYPYKTGINLSPKNGIYLNFSKVA